MARVRETDGQRARLPDPLRETRRQGLAEQVDLIAGVVHVELARRRVPGHLQQADERGPDRGRARAHDVHRTGGIRAHELDEHTFARTRIGTAVRAALGKDAGGQGGHERVTVAEVEEARPRHLDGRERRAFEREVLGDRVGDGARRLLGRLRQDHREVRGPIAMRSLPRDREFDVVHTAARIDAGRRECRRESVAQLTPHQGPLSVHRPTDARAGSTRASSRGTRAPRRRRSRAGSSA